MNGENCEILCPDKINRIESIKHIIFLMLNPSSVLTDGQVHKWYLDLILPAFAWMLFFLQVGLDRHRQSGYPPGKIVLLSFIGLIAGYVVVFLTGILMSMLLTVFGKNIRLQLGISCIALSHTYKTFSLILGLLYNFFGYSSSVAFGTVGLLATLLPVYSGIRGLTRGTTFLAPVLAALIGLIFLVFWQLVLKIGL